MQSLIITNSGEELISRLIAETATASFTKISASDHDYSGVDLKTLTELEDVKQTALISGISRIDTTLIEIVAAMDNTELETGYYTRALGVYAKYQDGNEILFGVSIEPDTPSYLPPFSGKTISSISYRLNIKVNNSEQVNIEVTPGAYPTVEQFNDLQRVVNTHTHDDRYYTETEINSKLEGKAAASHTHSASQVTDLPTSLPANGGSADTAVKLKTARNINGVAFDGSKDITVTAAANGGNADTVGGAAVMTTSALGLHRMASGTAAPTSATCPPGCWYGQYE